MATGTLQIKESENGRRIRVDVALVHYPVVNKNQETIGSAITNLDVHDIARAGRTFGVSSLYMVTPYEDQQKLFREIVDHWLTGPGSRYNSKRKEALSLVRFCNDLQELYTRVGEQEGGRPLIVTTCARAQQNTVGYDELRQKIRGGQKVLILLGTAWGLAPEVMSDADATLPPINGCGEYNHLSVRSAAAIVLDRLLGR